MTPPRRFTPAERAALIDRFSAAWAARDLDALMGMMSEDCTFRASVGPEPGTTFVGAEEVRRGFAQFLAPPPDPAPAVETVTEPPLVAEDFAVTRWTTSHSRGDGPPLVVRACDIFGFRGDRIAFKDTYRKAGAPQP